MPTVGLANSDSEVRLLQYLAGEDTSNRGSLPLHTGVLTKA